MTIGAVLLAALQLAATPARALSNYTATADARVISVVVAVSPPIVFTDLVDAGVTTAQAQIDSLGGTSAFASQPYPSQSIVSIPSLLAGLTNGLTSDLVPQYPFIATSSSAVPSDHRAAGTVVLDAQSSTGRSRGTVSDGLSQAIAETTLQDDSGVVMAYAESSLASIQLSSLLNLSGVRSEAKVVRSPTGVLERTSTFEVASLTILGQRIAVTNEGFTLPGVEIPGVDLSKTLGSLFNVLAGHGVTVEFLPGRETEDGVFSAGLRITAEGAVPPSIAAGLDTARVEVTVGQTTASVSGKVSANTRQPEVRTDTLPPSGSVGAAPIMPGLPTVSPGGAGVVPNAGRPGSPSANATPQPAAQPVSMDGLDVSFAPFYPVLLLALAVGLGLVSLIRNLGVRNP